MKPTIGRIVHYYPAVGVQPSAAIVTGVYRNPRMVDLQVFPRLGPSLERLAIFGGEGDGPGSRSGGWWSWPPRDGA